MDSSKDQLGKIAEARAGGVASLRIAWREAAERCVGVGLGAEYLGRAIESFDGPRTLALLGESLSGEDRAMVSGLFGKLVDDADAQGFTVDEWIAAIGEVLSYLSGRGRKAAYGSICGYVTCAAEVGSGIEIGVSLQESVRSFLAEHGFEG